MPSGLNSGPLAHTRGSVLDALGYQGRSPWPVSARPLVAIPDFVIPFLGTASHVYSIAGGWDFLRHRSGSYAKQKMLPPVTGGLASDRQPPWQEAS